MAATQTPSPQRTPPSGARAIAACARPCIATSAVTRQGLQERLFTLAFSGLVYPQIWEDPVVDLEALRPRSRASGSIAIASGGCNVLSYLASAPVSITAVDLNPAHVALNKLKLAALAHLPDYDAFCRFFAEADGRHNIDAYRTHLRAHLDADDPQLLGVARPPRPPPHQLLRHATSIATGLLGALHRRGASAGAPARRQPAPPARGQDAATSSAASSSASSAPLFEKRHIRWLLERPSSLFGLGIPPSQFAALKGERDEHGRRAAWRGSSGSPATSTSPTTTSPGRRSAAATPAAAAARCRPTCSASSFETLRAARRRRRRRARLADRAPRSRSRRPRSTPTCCSTRRTG